MWDELLNMQACAFVFSVLRLWLGHSKQLVRLRATRSGFARRRCTSTRRSTCGKKMASCDSRWLCVYTWVSQLVCVVSGMSGSEEQLSDEWSPGRHSFAFEWQLSENLPNSFEGSHGAVRFYARGILSLPGCRSSCQKCFVNTRYFTVLRHLDLNSNPTFTVHHLVYSLNNPG